MSKEEKTNGYKASNQRSSVNQPKHPNMRALPSNCNFQCHRAMPGEPVVIPDNPVFSLAGIRVSPFRRLSRAKTNPRATSATNRPTYFRVNEKQMLAEPILTGDGERQPNRPVDSTNPANMHQRAHLFVYYLDRLYLTDQSRTV